MSNSSGRSRKGICPAKQNPLQHKRKIVAAHLQSMLRMCFVFAFDTQLAESVRIANAVAVHAHKQHAKDTVSGEPLKLKGCVVWSVVASLCALWSTLGHTRAVCGCFSPRSREHSGSHASTEMQGATGVQEATTNICANASRTQCLHLQTQGRSAP